MSSTSCSWYKKTWRVICWSCTQLRGQRQQGLQLWDSWRHVGRWRTPAQVIQITYRLLNMQHNFILLFPILFKWFWFCFSLQEAQLDSQTLPGDAVSNWKHQNKPERPKKLLVYRIWCCIVCSCYFFPITESKKLQLPLRQALDLPQGTLPARMVVKLLPWGCRRAWVQCWPLLADIQQHLHRSSQSLFVTGKSSPLGFAH